MNDEAHIRDISAKRGQMPAVRLRRDVQVTESVDKSGARQIFMKVPATDELFQFGEEEHFLCTSLGDDRRFEEVAADFEARFGTSLSEAQFQNFVDELDEMGLLQSAETVWNGDRSEPHASSEPPIDVEDIPDEADDGAAIGAAIGASSAPATGPASRPPPRKAGIPMRFHLVDLSTLFRLLAWLFHPVRWAVWLIVPLTLMAGLILFHRQPAFVADVQALTARFTGVAPFLVGLFLVNLTSRLVQGVVLTAFGAEVRSLGILFVFGIIPRFNIDRSGATKLERRGALWSYAAPLLTRLALFGLGTFAWVAFRRTGTWLPDLALHISQIGFWSFVITSLPLVQADGYKWLTAYLEQPTLRQRAMHLLGMQLRGRPTPMGMTSRDRWGLLFYAVGVVIFMGAMGVGVLLYLGPELEHRFRGVGVLMFVGVFTLALLWLIAVRRSVKRMRPQGRPERAAARPPFAAPSGQRALVPAGRNLPALRQPTEIDRPRPPPLILRPRRSKSRWKAQLVWLCLLGVIGYVAFLPYRYEVGGEFKVLPAARTEIRARVDGELIDVYVDEGDWVEKGQLLGVLSDWGEVRNLAVTKAQLDKAKAELARLKEMPRPEEINLAREQVESVKARLPFSQAEADRTAQLLKKGVVSTKRAEEAEKQLKQDLSALTVARANLELVKTGPMVSDIDAAKAEVRRLTTETGYRQAELDRTRLYATAPGRIITPNLQLMRGKYLPVGGLFAEVEDYRVARAEVDVSEVDISEVQVGDEVRLKAWALSESTRTGKVTAIAPSAAERELGLFLRVKTEIPNSDGLLKPNMTGYAKIEGPEIPVWKAYTRMILRFFRIEFWAWIP